MRKNMDLVLLRAGSRYAITLGSLSMLIHCVDGTCSFRLWATSGMLCLCSGSWLFAGRAPRC